MTAMKKKCDMNSSFEKACFVNEICNINICNKVYEMLTVIIL